MVYTSQEGSSQEPKEPAASPKPQVARSLESAGAPDGAARSKRGFSDGTYAAPFGRYEGPEPTESPNNEFLVGRKRERKQLLNMLFTRGRKGAYLVTGHRGTGKTSFVMHCLEEYKSEVYGRFLRGNVGKAWILDRIGLLVVVAAILASLIILSDVGQFIYRVWDTGTHDWLNDVAVIPVLIICAYPCFVAMELFELCLSFGRDMGASSNPAPNGPWWGRPVSFLFIAFAAHVLLIGPYVSQTASHWWILTDQTLLKNPLEVVAGCTFAIATAYAITEIAFAFRAAATPERWEVGLAKRRLHTMWIFALAAASVMVWLLATNVDDSGPPHPLHSFDLYLYLASWAFTCGLLAHKPSSRPGSPSDVDQSHEGWRLVLKVLALVGLVVWTALRGLPGKMEALALVLALLLTALPWLRANERVTRVRQCFATRVRSTLGKRGSAESAKAPPNSFPPETEAAKEVDKAVAKTVDKDVALQWGRSVVIVALKGLAMLLFGLQFLWVTLTTDQLDEEAWIGLAMALFFLISYLESEWIIRVFARSRAGVKLDPIHKDAEIDHRERYQKVLTESTFFWFIFLAWLPVLTISINLGIEKLVHRRVVESMLVGLREAYAEAFVHWRSVLANAGRALRFGVLIFMMTLAGDHFFSPPEMLPSGNAAESAASKLNEPKRLGDFCRAREKRGLLGLLCQVGSHGPNGEATVGETIVEALRIDLLEDPSGQKRDDSAGWTLPDKSPPRRLFEYVLPTSVRCVKAEGTTDSPNECTTQDEKLRAGPTFEAKHFLEFRVYHILLLLVLYGVSRWFDKRWPLIPYRNTLTRINRVVDSLSSRVNEEGWSGPSVLSESWQRLVGPRRVVSKHTDPVDSRTVELEFLKILHDIQSAALQLPFASRFHLSVPVPELIFVFDELDKVGTRGRDEVTAERAEPSPGEPFDEERERSRALHSLFADLKNILSSASARFLFIGGRNLHDEWLADQTARQPLLTRMFHAEVYIPTFLTDASLACGDEGWNIRLGAGAFLRRQAARAERLHEVWRRKRHGPWLSSGYDERHAVSFEGASRATSSKSDHNILSFYDCDAPFDKDKNVIDSSSELNDDLLTFLTYRSLGNVKRLKELFESFLRDVEDAGKVGDDFAKLLVCEHAVVIDDMARHRIQLIAAVFSRLRGILDGRPVSEDDKLAPAVFYLSDFLLKFHRRAFSRGNLERVDELVHIHRAPDLRGVLQEIVRAWSGTVLHPIRNGMYDYRFQSDVAQEIRLASRGSEEELAALNFTLDESQSLKAMYRSRLKTAPRVSTFELEAVLGELHEFDEEYETARQHYRNALHALDEQINQDMIREGARPALQEVLGGTAKGRKIARMRPVWAIARVRLMLQTAMTYEHSVDLESAAAEYRNARSLANLVIEAMTSEPDAPDDSDATSLGGPSTFISTLKHLHILFQPALAEAWVSEKQEAGVDTGPALVEQDLRALRSRLPFVKEGLWDRAPATSASAVRHANFALTLAELHDKAGDLHFLKGRQVRARGDDAPVGSEGYLIRAHYHYAVSLQEVRSFLWYRRQSSGAKLGWPGTGGKEQPPATIEAGGLPDFAAQVASGTLTDLAEALIARTSFDVVVAELGAPGHSSMGWTQERSDACKCLLRTVKEWLDGDPSRGIGVEWGQSLREVFGVPLSELRLDHWLGAAPDPSESKKGTLLKLVDDKSQVARLCTALVFSKAAANVLADDSRIEDAARETMQVVETICQLLWWRALRSHLSGGAWSKEAGRIEPVAFWKCLLAIGIESLQQADGWWSRSRRAEPESKTRYRVGDEIPVRAATLACSLALAAKHMGFEDASTNRVFALLEGWMGSAGAAKEGNSRAWFRERLRSILSRHSFPMGNRVLGLRVLIDDAVFGAEGLGPEIEGHVDELSRYALRHQAIMHFAPLHFGTSIGAYFLREDANDRWGTEALNHLSASRQMYTMGPKYYELVSDLYYLYDDFNDRRIHFSHAIQMAGADVASLLELALQSKLMKKAPALPEGCDDVGERESSDRVVGDSEV